MNKLFWIVCEDKNSTLYEGRYQGRTRTAAIKFLKITLGRSSLKDLVFTVTEIPVPLIREIVVEVLETLQREVQSGGFQLGGKSWLDNELPQSHATSDKVSVHNRSQPARQVSPSPSQIAPTPRPATS